MRAEEARGRGSRVQRPRAELAGDLPPGAVRAGRAGSAVRRRMTQPHAAGTRPAAPAPESYSRSKPWAVELQGTAVLGHRSHDVVGRAIGNLGVDLQGHRHVGPDESGQMRDHLRRRFGSRRARRGWRREKRSRGSAWAAPRRGGRGSVSVSGVGLVAGTGGATTSASSCRRATSGLDEHACRVHVGERDGLPRRASRDTAWRPRRSCPRRQSPRSPRSAGGGRRRQPAAARPAPAGAAGRGSASKTSRATSTCRACGSRPCCCGLSTPASAC